MQDTSEILLWNANGRNRIVVFGSKGKQMFRDITIYLRRLHKVGMFCHLWGFSE